MSNEPLSASRLATEQIADGHQVGVRFSRSARLAAIEAHTAICDDPWIRQNAPRR